ncbi:unnamed protein product [Taenia asiatica]|uniref:Uncharacterized protein n=1 Tax=Taenia asiatica TaxID=60517 RepID=A0A0R3VYV7_TAEAS|nr:unnamed protein product [Taenia asiatica]
MIRLPLNQLSQQRSAKVPGENIHLPLSALCTMIEPLAVTMRPPTTTYAAIHFSVASQISHIPPISCISIRMEAKRMSRKHRRPSLCVHRCHRWQKCPPPANQQSGDPHSDDWSINHVSVDRP